MEPTKFDPASHPLTDDLKVKLKALVPEAFTEESIDFERLKTLLGEIVEEGQERYSFTWPGKTKAIRAAQTSSIGTLVPDKEASEDWDTTGNLYLEGDNLEILKLLQKSYTSKVKMIYIDPPYNTGKDFVYSDNYGEGLKTYLEYTGQVDGEGKKITTNTETDGRYHSKWLNMMYPRLMLARNLLKDDGVIFISIDDHEQANLKKICDEVFGAENYLKLIVRETGTPTGGGQEAFVNKVDYLLAYQKSSDFLVHSIPMTDSEIAIYNKEDERGKYLTRSLRRTGGEDRREDRPSMYYALTAPDGSIVYPVGPTGYESRWICGRAKYSELELDGHIEWFQTENGYVPHQKFYLGEAKKQPSNLWTGIEGNKKATRDVKRLFGDKKVFDFPKPIGLIRQLIQVSGVGNSDYVVDFFSGSATTGHAVMQLNAEDGGNRKFILAQLQEVIDPNQKSQKIAAEYLITVNKPLNIAELGRERIRLAGEKIKVDYTNKLAEREAPLDTGFRTYRLAASTFNPWDVNSEDDLQAKLMSTTSLIKTDANDEEVLTELILKSGYGLSEQIEETQIGGKKFYSVANGELLVSLGSGLDESIIRLVSEKEPKRFIAKEIGFESDSVLTNTAQIMKDKGIDFRVL